MRDNENIEEAIFWKIVCLMLILGAFLLSYYLGYKHGKNKYFDIRYQQGFYDGNYQKKQQITKDTELILYLKSKAFPEVNIVKYFLYNNDLKLSASIDMNEKNDQYDYSSLSIFNEKDLTINMLKDEIAKQLKEKFVIEEVNE